MATKKLFFLICILFSMVGTKALAYSLAAKNADGVTIYYDLYRDVNTNEEGAVVTYQKSYPDLTYYSDYTGNVVIPEEVTYLDRTIKVTTIGARAFWKCSGLTSVTIPNSVTHIDISAFYHCSSLTSITIPNGVTSIGDYTFAGCISLPSLTIPNGVTSIGKLAFLECSGLSSITIPNSVTSIGGRAFENCSGLTSVTLSNSLTSIEYNAFYGCSGLTSITIPNSVTNIEGSAFRDCSGLTEVISLIENPFIIKSNVFSDDTYKNANLIVPEGAIDKYKSTDGWKNFYDFKDNPNSGGDPAENPQEDDPAEDPQEDNQLANGVYIYDVFGNYTSPDVWQDTNNYKVIGVALITDNTRALIASHDAEDGNKVVWGPDGLVGGVISTESNGSNSSPGKAWDDFSGYDNTKLLVDALAPSDETALKLASNFVFPNGVKGYLPALGEMVDVFSYLDAINKALELIGGDKIVNDWYWTSTQHYTSYRAWAYGGKDSDGNRCFAQLRNEGSNYANQYGAAYIRVRPFCEIVGGDPDVGKGMKSIYVPKAGSLSSYISESEKYFITNLSLSGELNGDDLGFLREIAGKKRTSHNNFFNDTEGKLESLDISGAKIVPGGYSLLIEEIDNDFEYTVTRENEIPPRLFEGCSKLTNIKIPENVNSIGNSAFWGTKWYENQPDGAVYIGNVFYAYKGEMPANTSVAIKDGTLGIACSAFRNCTNLVSVTIPSSVTNIGGHNAYPNIGFDGAFYGCAGLNSVISEIMSPRAFDYNTFDSSGESIYSKATLYVPKGTIDLYKSTEGWNNFMNIVDTDPTGINKVMFSEEKNAPIFDLQGRHLSQPQKGINIIGGKKFMKR